jgi:GDP-L-fucose synthase
MDQMQINSKIYIAGHRGMVGSAIMRRLQMSGYSKLITRGSNALDLRVQIGVDHFFEIEKPEYVFLAAAKVGGILANNTFRADFLYENIMIQSNIIHAAYKYKVKKLLFLGSSCIYPKMASQPIKEEYLLTGLLEYTNEPYAIAKIAGIKMCEAFRQQYGCNFFSVMPTNLYGPNDNYDLNNSHVLPALIRKFHEGKQNNDPYVTIWGSGEPRREFLFSEDLADACIYLMEKYDDAGLINIGCGDDLKIIELANLIRKIVGYKGAIRRDLTKPDGTPRKLLDVSKLNNFGWRASTSLEEGISKAYQSFLSNPRPLLEKASFLNDPKSHV